jgi:hypothetical protein
LFFCIPDVIGPGRRLILVAGRETQVIVTSYAISKVKNLVTKPKEKEERAYVKCKDMAEWVKQSRNLQSEIEAV